MGAVSKGTTPDEAVELVALAMCCATPCEGCRGSGEGGCFDLGLWEREARAAIDAMPDRASSERIATLEAVLEAIKKRALDGSTLDDSNLVPMIDAALSEKAETPEAGQ